MHIDHSPSWLSSLLNCVEDCQADSAAIADSVRDTSNRSSDAVSRWIKSRHGFTFDAYLRLRRLAFQMNTHWMDLRSQSWVSPKARFGELIQSRIPALESKSDMIVLVNRILTPLGPMVVACSDKGVVLLEFADRRMLETQLVRIRRINRCEYRVGVNSIMKQLDAEMKEYFAGLRVQFDVAIQADGTDFQNAVWDQLKRIPAGATSTYQNLAQQIDKPKAVRAVGKATGDNRLSIVIPCHRVVGSDGSLTGYGGGLERKRWLLEHEKRTLQTAK